MFYTVLITYKVNVRYNISNVLPSLGFKRHNGVSVVPGKSRKYRVTQTGVMKEVGLTGQRNVFGREPHS